MSLFSLEWWQIALLFLPALLNLWGIWHAFNHTFETPLERVLWMVACVFVPVLGGVAYVLDKSRLSIRLVPPYSEERKAAASAYARKHGFQVLTPGKKTA